MSKEIVIFLVAIFFLYTFVILFGAPYLPTMKKRITDIKTLSKLKSGQTLIELGSGDGRVLLELAKQGIYGVGYELNPILVAYSKIKLLPYRKHTKIIWGNYWQEKLPEADVIYVFLLQKYMQKLNKKLIQNYPKGVKLVSFAFQIEGRKHQAELNGMYLYKYNKILKK